MSGVAIISFKLIANIACKLKLFVYDILEIHLLYKLFTSVNLSPLYFQKFNFLPNLSGKPKYFVSSACSIWYILQAVNLYIAGDRSAPTMLLVCVLYTELIYAARILEPTDTCL